MIISEKYKKETGLQAYTFSQLGSKLYSKKYIEWLEEQLTLTDVSKIVICENCNNWGETVDVKGVRNVCKECE